MNGRQRGTWLLSFCVTRLLSTLRCSEVKSCVKLVNFKLKIYFMLSYLGFDLLKPYICLMPRKVHMIRNSPEIEHPMTHYDCSEIYNTNRLVLECHPFTYLVYHVNCTEGRAPVLLLWLWGLPDDVHRKNSCHIFS